MSGRKKILIIANPFSGTSKKTDLDTMIDKGLDHSRYEADLAFTNYAGHGHILAKEGSSTYDIIVAVGGDGTVNEVASGIIGSDTVLGILPAGSGNGFAMHLGLGRNTYKAFAMLNKGKTQWVDTCSVNGRFFINVSGIGFDARIAYLTKLNKKRGFMHYLNTTLSQANKFKALPLTIETDDVILEGKFAAAVIANASMYGYNFTIAPTAALDDGLFDIMLIQEAPVYKYFFTSYRFLNKTLHQSPLVINRKSKHVKIIISENDYYHVDGEGFEMNDNLNFNILQKSMQVICL